MGDAAGRVAECELPWPQYGDDVNNQEDDRQARHWLLYMFPNFLSGNIPIWQWALAGNFMIVGWVLICAAYVYSFLACFGCFNKKFQKWFTNAVLLGAIFIIMA